MQDLISNYKHFLDNGKTERECVSQIIKGAREQGYKDISEYKTLKAGDKVYVQKMNKAIALFEIGTGNIEDGLNILGAHIDSPRLDAKQSPLYEKDFITYLNTHYYGGIKKYQWVTIPLAIHGVVCKTDGTTVNISIGEDASDPVFCISDILPHLAQEQMKKTGTEIIKGEDLDVIFGSIAPSKKEEKDSDDKKKEEKNTSKKAILAFNENPFPYGGACRIPTGLGGPWNKLVKKGNKPDELNTGYSVGIKKRSPEGLLCRFV